MWTKLNKLFFSLTSNKIKHCSFWSVKIFTIIMFLPNTRTMSEIHFWINVFCFLFSSSEFYIYFCFIIAAFWTVWFWKMCVYPSTSFLHEFAVILVNYSRCYWVKFVGCLAHTHTFSMVLCGAQSKTVTLLSFDWSYWSSHLIFVHLKKLVESKPYLAGWCLEVFLAFLCCFWIIASSFAFD